MRYGALTCVIAGGLLMSGAGATAFAEPDGGTGHNDTSSGANNGGTQTRGRGPANNGGTQTRGRGPADNGGTLTRGRGPADNGGTQTRGRGPADNGGTQTRGRGPADNGGTQTRGRGPADNGGTQTRGRGPADNGGTQTRGRGPADNGGTQTRGRGPADNGGTLGDTPDVQVDGTPAAERDRMPSASASSPTISLLPLVPPGAPVGPPITIENPSSDGLPIDFYKPIVPAATVPAGLSLLTHLAERSLPASGPPPAELAPMGMDVPQAPAPEPAVIDQSQRPSMPSDNSLSPLSESVSPLSEPVAFRAGYSDYLRNAGTAQITTIAAPGAAAILLFSLGGGFIGYRQARAGHVIRAKGITRFLP